MHIYVSNFPTIVSLNFLVLGFAAMVQIERNEKNVRNEGAGKIT